MKLHSLWAMLCPLWAFGLFFGGDGGSSSQASTTTTTNTTNTADRRVVADGGSTVLGDGSTVHQNTNVTTTDLGAIQRGADLAEAAVVGATKLATEASASGTTLAQKAIEQVARSYSEANQQAQDTYSGNKTLSTLGLIVAGIVALAVFSQKKA